MVTRRFFNWETCCRTCGSDSFPRVTCSFLRKRSVPGTCMKFSWFEFPGHETTSIVNVARNVLVWISAVSSLYPEWGAGWREETAEIQTSTVCTTLATELLSLQYSQYIVTTEFSIALSLFCGLSENSRKAKSSILPYNVVQVSCPCLGGRGGGHLARKKLRQYLNAWVLKSGCKRTQNAWKTKTFIEIVTLTACILDDL